MKILLQHLGNGRTFLQDVPAPSLQKNHVLIRTTRSVVSPGTERMLVDFGKGNLLQKAQQQPERVKQVLNKMRTDGVLPTLRTVRRKLDQPIPLGYCNAGVVIGVGEGVEGFSVGDRVASNGYHAEVVSVPKNLVAKIPDDVSDSEAAFAPLAAIALHGFRMSGAGVGDTVVIIGLGLVGSLTMQWADAAGCRVIGFDVRDDAVQRSKRWTDAAYNLATADAEAVVRARTAGLGADAVLVCTATDTDEPLRTAATVCRAGGAVILVGTADIRFPRRAMFDKEIRFAVSRSYGPGRYDAGYERGGQDYPAQYARWTAGRNIQAAVDAMGRSAHGGKRIFIDEIPAETMPFEKAPAWYTAPPNPSNLATVFQYSGDAEVEQSKITSRQVRADTGAGIGILGAGPFVQGTLLPVLKSLGAPLHSIASGTGISAGIFAGKFFIPSSTSNYRTVLEDPSVGLVIIATPHDTHADLVREALAAGKAVYVEKPLAISRDGLAAIEHEIAGTGPFLHIGHNRRFAPLAVRAMALLQPGVPRHMVVTVNAGVAPAPPGGRFVGEAGHWIDLCAFFAGAPITKLNAVASPDGGSTMVQLVFGNGSTASIQYLTAGSARYEKERIEIHSAGTTAVIRAWRRLDVWSGGSSKTMRATQDKGHRAQLAAVVDAFRKKRSAPVPFEVAINVSRALLAAAESMRERRWVEVD